MDYESTINLEQNVLADSLQLTVNVIQFVSGKNFYPAVFKPNDNLLQEKYSRRVAIIS